MPQAKREFYCDFLRTVNRIAFI